MVISSNFPQAVPTTVIFIKEGSDDDNKNNNDDANPDINDAGDIESYDAVVVAGIYLTYMLDENCQDLQTLWNCK